MSDCDRGERRYARRLTQVSLGLLVLVLAVLFSAWARAADAQFDFDWRGWDFYCGEEHAIVFQSRRAPSRPPVIAYVFQFGPFGARLPLKHVRPKR